VSHPDGLPDLFVDRSLGRIVVPRLLREAGLRLITLAERYGIPADENVADVTWLADAGQRGEAVLMKDERISRDGAERAAVVNYRVRCFCLSRRDLTGSEMAALYVHHLPAIAAACTRSGPGIWMVSRAGVRPLDR
jgi:PIN like domain